MEIFGYHFKNAALLQTALTTPSCRMDDPYVRDNQRLEFLGDAVLGLLSAARLYETSPNEPEGPLTVRRAHMVSTAALCEAAARHDFVARLKRNLSAAKQPLECHAKTIADAVEAVFGAAYLDGGFPAAQRIFDALELVSYAENGAWSVNPKGDLQIFTQSLNPPLLPVYETLETKGPPHKPTFLVRVSVEGFGAATASANRRQDAEAEAAAELLRRIRAETAPET